MMTVQAWFGRSQILALVCWLGSSQMASAQFVGQPGTRQSRGWRPVAASNPGVQTKDFGPSLAVRPPLAQTNAAAEPSIQPAVQTAYFQAQGTLSDGLPAFPGASVYPAQSAEIPVNRPGVPAQLASSGELRSIQNGRLPSEPEVTPPGHTPRNQLTSGAAQPASPGARLDPQSITTGYPFVAPPPRGRYATSAYQPAVFQTAYQAPGVPAQLTSAQIAAQSTMPAPALVTPPAVATNQYLTPQQAALPQFRYPQPGIYATGYQCTAPVPSFPSTGVVPGASIPPTLPPNLTPGLYTPNNSGYTPLFSLGQENYNVQLGRGIIGQPTVYVPGQPVRNFMRYLSP